MAATQRSPRPAAKAQQPPAMHKGLPIFGFSTVRRWETWLGKRHDTCEGIWVKLAKKGAAVSSITYEQARDVAIAYGWIDGLKNAIDESFFAIRFTPRRPRSKWSRINRRVAEELIASGRMKPPGLAQVEAARKDGRWEAAYPGARDIEVHPDLLLALRDNAPARKFFAQVKGAARYAILLRVLEAKRPETRARRIEQFVAMLARGELPVR